MHHQSMRITREEHLGRCHDLLALTRGQGLNGLVLFDSVNIHYYTGFAFIPTERPIAFVLTPDGGRGMLVPRLEREHAAGETALDQIADYPEYPGDPPAIDQLRHLLSAMGLLRAGGRLGADANGYPWIFGYEGPTLEELTGMVFVNVQGAINRQQAIKSPAELALIRESCKWGHLAHMLLQRYTAVGVTETSASLRATQEATLVMMDTIGPLYRAQSPYSDGPAAGYRGQIGRQAAIPHALANNITFQPGDVLVTGAGCPVWGYHSELERTMFVGEPSPKQKNMFHHARTGQEIAFSAMRPGVTCSRVDEAVRHYYEDNDLLANWRHHTGHAIGMRYHEGPFLDTGDETVLEEGMVFTIEPGFYDPEMGGFRHSDTVAITADGIEIMTYYPRGWEDLVIPT